MYLSLLDVTEANAIVGVAVAEVEVFDDVPRDIPLSLELDLLVHVAANENLGATELGAVLDASGDKVLDFGIVAEEIPVVLDTATETELEPAVVGFHPQTVAPENTDAIRVLFFLLGGLGRRSSLLAFLEIRELIRDESLCSFLSAYPEALLFRAGWAAALRPGRPREHQHRDDRDYQPELLRCSG